MNAPSELSFHKKHKSRAERLSSPPDKLITITVPPKAESARNADIKISAKLLAGFLTIFLRGKESIDRILFLFM